MIMSIVNKKIISVKELLELNLSIPSYQRTYSWKQKNVNQLFNDVKSANEKKLSEYRIGTIVIHRHQQNDNETLDIVDGQQRIITLKLLQKIIVGPEELFTSDSQIKRNYSELSRLYSKLAEFTGDKDDTRSIEQESFSKYLNENCNLILIELNNEAEAFQFFDSQNSRGKSLAVHDLLKAYHLREMSNINITDKVSLITKWEELDSRELSILFEKYLYRIRTWGRNQDGLTYSSRGTEEFKGIKMNDTSNFVQYHKAAHLFIENFNKQNYQELLGQQYLNAFQIDQPILAGRRFFEYTLHYFNLKKKMDKIIEEILPKSISPYHDANHELIGTSYTRELLESLLLYYYDKYGLDNRNKYIENDLLKYSYSLRLLNHAVFERSINKYALGNNERLNKDLNYFEKIKYATANSDIEMIQLDNLSTKNVIDKYNANNFEDLRNKLEVIIGE